jgi:hypothetical protein
MGDKLGYIPMRATPNQTLFDVLIMDFNNNLYRLGYPPLNDKEVREIYQQPTRKAKEAAFEKIVQERDFNAKLNTLGYLPLDDEELDEINKHSTLKEREDAFKQIYDKRYAEREDAFKILNGMGGGVKHSQRTSKTTNTKKQNPRKIHPKPYPRKIHHSLRNKPSFITATFSPQVAMLRRYAIFLKEIHGIDTLMDEDDKELLLRQHDDDSREAAFNTIVEKHKRLRNAGKKRTKSRKTSKKRRSRTR